MDIPGLGMLTKDDQVGLCYSKPVPVAVLDGKLCRIGVFGYEEDPEKEDFHTAIANFLAITPTVLKAAEPHVYRYYQTCNACWEPSDDEFLDIKSPGDVWRHIQFGSEAIVQRRAEGDRVIYVSLECECDWEPEHGLQIVFKNGLRVNKIGQFDGHLTNSDAFDDDSLEDVVYVD